MFTNARIGCLLLGVLIGSTIAAAQQPAPPAQVGAGRIYLDVVVTPKSGPPVTDLQQQDFTLLDNKAPQTITSFKVVTGREAPIEVVLVVDAVNTTAQIIDSERIQIDKFLRADGGNLLYPIALAVFTDDGIKSVSNFSSDGNALSASLKSNDIGLRDIGRSAGYWGASERLQLSLKALSQLVASLAPRPGRKLILWVSPGWPLLNNPGIQFDSRQQQNFFAMIVGISTDLRLARITLYSINPLGAGESPDGRLEL